VGISIHSYVSLNGWGNFRELEKEIVKDVAAKDNLVIATGGGVVIDQENVRNLRKNGWIVWLDTEAPVIRARMQKEEESGELRPPLSGIDPVEEIDRVLRGRIPYYEGASDHTVDANGPPPEEVAREILMTPKSCKRRVCRRCKAARAQTYSYTSSPCQHSRFGKIGAPGG